MRPSLLEMSKTTNQFDLREYLRVAGWAPVVPKNPRLGVFRKTDESNSLELVLPRSADVVNFALRVAETARTLASSWQF